MAQTTTPPSFHGSTMIPGETLSASTEIGVPLGGAVIADVGGAVIADVGGAVIADVGGAGV